MRIVGVLLAAGAGVRFGGGKLLAKLDDGTPIAVRACRTLVAALDDVMAVVRPGDPALMEALQRTGAQVSMCVESVDGIGASIAHGVARAKPCDAVVVALADMPWVTPATVRAIVRALESGSALVVPRHGSRRGNPVGFGRANFNALDSLSGDRGARDLIDSASDVVWLEVDDPGILRDVDVPEDLRSNA